MKEDKTNEAFKHYKDDKIYILDLIVLNVEFDDSIPSVVYYELGKPEQRYIQSLHRFTEILPSGRARFSHIPKDNLDQYLDIKPTTTNNEYLRQRLEIRAGLATYPEDRTIASLRSSQWDKDFEIFRRNRMVLGGMRYGPFRHPEKPIYDNIESIEAKCKLYRETGNDELLADIANIAQCEFTEGIHPNKHFEATDDTEHTEKKK